jgi:hypothetical protein
MTGRYVFRVTGTPLDTRTMSDGTYVLVVTAADTAGNRDIGRLSFHVANGLSAS